MTKEEIISLVDDIFSEIPIDCKKSEMPDIKEEMAAIVARHVDKQVSNIDDLTLVERAEDYALTHDDKWQVAIFKGYLQGATEQKQIDNKQLCEMVLDEQNAIIDKACDYLRELEGWDALNDKPCPMFTEEDINEFIKFMKGEE